MGIGAVHITSTYEGSLSVGGVNEDFRQNFQYHLQYREKMEKNILLNPKFQYSIIPIH